MQCLASLHQQVCLHTQPTHLLLVQEEVFLTIARKAALEAAQSSASSPSGAKKKDLPFCSTCLKVLCTRIDSCS
jgi:hypothetical protein